MIVYGTDVGTHVLHEPSGRAYKIAKVRDARTLVGIPVTVEGKDAGEPFAMLDASECKRVAFDLAWYRRTGRLLLLAVQRGEESKTELSTAEDFTSKDAARLRLLLAGERIADVSCEVAHGRLNSLTIRLTNGRTVEIEYFAEWADDAGLTLEVAL